MTEQDSTLTRHDLEAKIVKRCWEDEAFRKEFTTNPAAVFLKYLQVPAANLGEIVVHEEPAGSWHIVLPQRPVNAGELSEQDLERVAGGTIQSAISVEATVTLIIRPISIAILAASATASAAASAGGVVSAAVSVAKGW